MKDSLSLIRKNDSLLVFRTPAGCIFSLPADNPELIVNICNTLLASLHVPNGVISSAVPESCLIGDSELHLQESKDTYDMVKHDAINLPVHIPDKVEGDADLKALSSHIDPNTGMAITTGTRFVINDVNALGLSFADYGRGDTVTLLKPLNEEYTKANGAGWSIEKGYFILLEELVNPNLCKILPDYIDI